MRIPDPKANTTTEAYLAYKAGYLEESELKPSLYEPYLHFDGWLAYWAGLVPMYPIKSPGKNLFNKNDIDIGYNWAGAVQSVCYPYNLTQRTRAVYLLPVKPNTEYTVSLASSDWYVMEIVDVDSNFTILSKSKTTQDNAFTQTITTGEHFAFLGFKFKYGSAGTTTITKEMLSELKLQVELGDTATSYEDYTGEPEMLTDEEALVAYLSGVTNTYPEEIKDPYDVRIVGYLKYLVSARWGRPEYPVNNEEFYLSTMKPPVVPSGDTPSSDIEMDDTAEAPFIDLKAYGDTSQTTYTGKNLFNVYGVGGTSVGDNLVSYTAENEELTVTQVGANGNGYVWVRLDKDKFLGKELTLSVGKVTSYDGSTGPRIRFTDQNGANIEDVSFTLLPDREPTKTFSVPSELPSGVTELRLYIYVNKSYVAGQVGATSKYTKLQIEVGSSATSYEPYVGGVPAPNPDYPQNVNVVTGRQVVEVKNKNLFYLPNSETRNDVTFTKNPDGTFDLFGVPSDNTNFSIVVEGKLESGEYTLSRDTGNFNIAVQDYNSSGWLSQLLTLNNASKSTGSIDPVGTRTGFVVQAKVGVNYDLKNVQVQLEKGSSNTDFVSYAKENYEINLGKNLFDKNNPNVIVGTVEAGGYNASGSNKSFYLKCESNTTYTIQKRNDGDTNRFIIATANTIPVQGTAMSGLTQKNNDSSVTITTGNDAKYIVCTFYRNTEATLTEQELIDSIQVEVGDTATSYAPYFEPIELCKIGDYQDYIYRDEDGDWYVHKAIGKITYTGNSSENWQYSGTSSGAFRIAIPNSKYHTSNDVAPLVYCDYYTPVKWNSITSYKYAVTAFNNNVLPFRNMDIADLGAWKAWLGSHNMTVYYPFATSTDTQITNYELISQLDALMEGGSYEGKTYIKVTATDPNLPGLLYVEAGKYD